MRLTSAKECFTDKSILSYQIIIGSRPFGHILTSILQSLPQRIVWTEAILETRIDALLHLRCRKAPARTDSSRTHIAGGLPTFNGHLRLGVRHEVRPRTSAAPKAAETRPTLHAAIQGGLVHPQARALLHLLRVLHTAVCT